jgi:ketosteroid isomerase-like protein
MSDRARTFIHALERLEHAGDAEPITALFSDLAEIVNPTDARRGMRGIDGARRFWTAYRASFTAMRSEFRNIVEHGDVAVLEWTTTARTSTGANVDYAGVSVLEFDGDRIRRFRAYFDSRDLADRPDPHGDVGA